MYLESAVFDAVGPDVSCFSCKNEVLRIAV